MLRRIFIVIALLLACLLPGARVNPTFATEKYTCDLTLVGPTAMFISNGETLDYYFQASYYVRALTVPRSAVMTITVASTLTNPPKTKTILTKSLKPGRTYGDRGAHLKISQTGEISGTLKINDTPCASHTWHVNVFH